MKNMCDHFTMDNKCNYAWVEHKLEVRCQLNGNYEKCKHGKNETTEVIKSCGPPKDMVDRLK